MNKKFSVLILAQVAVLLAMEVVLSRFFSIATPITKFSFAFVPLAVCGALFGPVWGGVMGALADLLGAILFPIGPYFPGYTLNNALHGVASWPWCLTMWWWAFSCLLCGAIFSPEAPIGRWWLPGPSKPW